MTDQKVLPLMQLVIFAVWGCFVLVFFFVGGAVCSSAMNKENVEVAYALLILRILSFSILKCNV